MSSSRGDGISGERWTLMWILKVTNLGVIGPQKIHVQYHVYRKSWVWPLASNSGICEGLGYHPLVKKESALWSLLLLGAKPNLYHVYISIQLRIILTKHLQYKVGPCLLLIQ